MPYLIVHPQGEDGDGTVTYTVEAEYPTDHPRGPKGAALTYGEEHGFTGTFEVWTVTHQRTFTLKAKTTVEAVEQE